MNRKARRRAIWLLERRRLLRGAGTSVVFAAPRAVARDGTTVDALVEEVEEARGTYAAGYDEPRSMISCR